MTPCLHASKPPRLRASVPPWQKMRNLFSASFLIAIFGLMISENAVAQQEDIKTLVLQEVNAIRAKGCNCGGEEMPPVKPLAWNEKLEKAAIRHANDMWKNQHFDHVGTDGSSMSERIDDTGYKWSMLGENICWGHSNVSEAIQGWLESDGHCRNMMSPVFKDIGVAVKGTYWVMDLGAGKF